MLLQILANRTYRHLFRTGDRGSLSVMGLATVAPGPLAYQLAGYGCGERCWHRICAIKMVAYVGGAGRNCAG